MKNTKTVLIDKNPGRNSQTFGIARELGTDLDLIHEPSIGVIGNKGDSQCYLGVSKKVNIIHEVLKKRIGKEPNKLAMRLIQPEFSLATSDGIRNGTKEMRYSLIGREVTNDSVCEHLSATGVEGIVAVVACDKPPVGTLAAILEHNRPAIIMSDGSIRPGKDSVTGEPLDIISSYQIAGSKDEDLKKRIALESCPGIGSCGGMFTYNTMQTFIGVIGMQPLHMVSPASEDSRRLDDFPNESTQWSDSDNDGYGDNEDGLNGDDCVLTFGTSYIDKFGCLDSDNDGYSDVFDDCVDEAGTSSEGVIGCIDQDGDGFADIVDECPNDETKWEYGISCIDSEIVTEEPNKNENTTIEENNNEENIVGQCTCPDGSIGMLVGPSDDDGTPDGCSCSNLNNESSESSSNLEFDDIISIIILLFSIILLLLFVKQVRGVSSRKKFRNNISEEMKINAAFESEDFASGGWDEIDMRK